MFQWTVRWHWQAASALLASPRVGEAALAVPRGTEELVPASPADYPAMPATHRNAQ